MAEKNHCENSGTDDIDEALLDSAFEEFDQVKQTKSKTDTTVDGKSAGDSKKSSSIKPSPSTKATTSNVLPPDENLWSDEYFQQMTQDLQKNMESLVNGDPSQLDSLLEHLMNDVAKVSTDGQTSSSIPNTCSSSEDAQSIEDKLKATMDEITQGLSNLPVNNLGNIMRGEGDESTGDGASPNMMPFLEDIMQQFLSKDVLYPVFSETCAKYPEWLEKNKDKLSAEEFANYSKQNDIMSRVVAQFDAETDTDSPAVKKARFNTILELLQEMQQYGSPPKDLVGDDAAFPSGMGGANALGNLQQGCCVM
ncbi:hypothetical protein M8J77_021921 [Diaphorina citri]|nr:hypothetical protein M8J77_021921 [Diaphorina citri]